MKIIRSLFVELVLLIVLFALSGCADSTEDLRVAAEQESFVGSESVCHAMGAIDGVDYTNSLEAFQKNYRTGFRFFEVDFSYTLDHHLVCMHDWSAYMREMNITVPYDSISYADYIATPIYGKYTALDINALAQLMREYEDVYVITDTKRPAKIYIQDDYAQIYTALEAAQAGLCDRLIFQVYSLEGIEVIRSISPDQKIIFTTYMSGMTGDEIAEAILSNSDLWAVTVPVYDLSESISDAAVKAGVRLYVHTVNDAEELSSLPPVSGIYSDILPPSEVEPFVG